MRLSEFGGSYKQAASFKTDGRAMALILKSQGKHESDALWSAVFDCKKVLDISKIPEGSSFMENSWFWGFDAKLSGAHFAPNGAALLRAVASGEMRVICFFVKDVMDRMQQQGVDLNLSKMTELVLSLSKDDPLVGKGFSVLTAQDDVIYVPPGMVLCEISTSAVLLYGARKSFIINNEACVDSFGHCIEILKQSNRDPSKMKAIVELYNEFSSSKGVKNQSNQNALASAGVEGSAGEQAPEAAS